MNDIKIIVAKNISELRQACGMTQYELAEKLNYTDKAVSKWERAESMPDISVLVEIADLFGVSLDFLVRAEHSENETRREISRSPKYNRGVITSVSVLLVWFVALFFFVLLSIISPSIKAKWLCFVYAMPAAAIVWLVMNSIWFNRRLNYFIITLLMWSALVATHVTFLPFGFNIWQIYLLGIPGQVSILLWSMMKKPRKRPDSK